LKEKYAFLLYIYHHSPWIENHFIRKFYHLPLSSFNGLIPLFGQWVDIHVNEFIGHDRRIPPYRSIVDKLEKILRRNVLYLAVSQDDDGLYYLQQKFPNVLSLSAGGYGHVPIPLVKGEIDFFPLLGFKWDFSFFGSDGTHASRASFIKEVKKVSHSTSLVSHFGVSEHWKENIASTKFNLAPRGFGRSSFRLVEVIQIGRIPIYIYNDEPWIPYDGTSHSIRNFGLVYKMDDIPALVSKIDELKSNVTYLLDAVKATRRHYTYDGVIEQIKLFIEDPLGPNGGDLRCAKVPDTMH
jgi:hypothetical protein